VTPAPRAPHWCNAETRCPFRSDASQSQRTTGCCVEGRASSGVLDLDRLATVLALTTLGYLAVVVAQDAERTTVRQVEDTLGPELLGRPPRALVQAEEDDLGSRRDDFRVVAVAHDEPLRQTQPGPTFDLLAGLDQPQPVRLVAKFTTVTRRHESLLVVVSGLIYYIR
jgi:hypothetical protein